MEGLKNILETGHNGLPVFCFVCRFSGKKKARSKVLQHYTLKGLSRHATFEIARKRNSSLCASKVHTELPHICSDTCTPKILILALQVSFQQWVVCFKMEHLFSLKIYQVFDLY